MNVDECIENRRSIRRFKDKQVNADDALSLVDAARKAPSAGNLQAWKFILIKNQSKKNQIADACYQQNWISEAPLLIVPVSLNEEVKRHYGTRGDILYTIQDCALASQNIMLKAKSLGLDSCFVSAFEEGMIKRILSIPDNARAQAIIAIGYADETPKDKIINNIEAVIYFEEYLGRLDNDFDEAFYNWSGIMKKHATAILENIRKHSSKIHSKLKDQIKNKMK